jgi:formylglycine-generating enzyme required for sulfatase activity
MTDLSESMQTGEPTLRFRFGDAHWELVRIPPGQFEMGAPLDEPGRLPGELAPLSVTIARPFYIGRCEITRAQLLTIMPDLGDLYAAGDSAADQIRYTEVLEYCSRLSVVAGVEITLPTEAQWEYACRAGTETRFYSGNTDADLDRIAWYRENSGGQVHPVAQKEPNAWGLYDMLGNVFEPCIDYILNVDRLDPVDPIGEVFGTHGAIRGGAWMMPADRCRAAFRMQSDDMFGGMGIRIAINP